MDVGHAFETSGIALGGQALGRRVTGMFALKAVVAVALLVWWRR